MRAFLPYAAVLGLALGCDSTHYVPRDAHVDAEGDASDAEIDAPDAEPPPRLAECERDSDCEDAICVGDLPYAGEDLDPMPLGCGQARADAAEVHEVCVRNEECARGLCVVAGTCVVPCVENRDCGDMEVCAEVFVRSGVDALQPVHACLDRANLREDTHLYVDRREIGRGFSELFPGSRFPTLVVLRPDRVTSSVTRVETRASDAEVLFDVDEVVDHGPAPRNGVSIFGRVVTLLVPNGARSEASESGYEISFESAIRDRAEAYVLSRELPGDTVDLDVFFVGARTLAWENGETPDRLRGMLTTGNDILAQQGIAIGDVRLHEVVGGLRERYAVLESDENRGLPELEPLLSLSAGVSRLSVSVFILRSMDGLLGISGSVPGPSGIHGTAASGIALGADQLGGGLGPAFAHELSHFLGLFHTSEVDGTVFEPITDTEECRPAQDMTGEGALTGDECTGHGADNLMFWQLTGTRLTVEQGEVFHRSPTTR